MFRVVDGEVVEKYDNIEEQLSPEITNYMLKEDGFDENSCMR